MTFQPEHLAYLLAALALIVLVLVIRRNMRRRREPDRPLLRGTHPELLTEARGRAAENPEDPEDPEDRWPLPIVQDRTYVSKRRPSPGGSRRITGSSSIGPAHPAAYAHPVDADEREERMHPGGVVPLSGPPEYVRRDEPMENPLRDSDITTWHDSTPTCAIDPPPAADPGSGTSPSHDVSSGGSDVSVSSD